VYSPGPSIATISNIGYYFYVENVGHRDRNYLKNLCFAATVSKNFDVMMDGVVGTVVTVLITHLGDYHVK